MRGLKKVYEGKIDLTVKSIKEPGLEELGKKHFPDLKHGLLAYSPDGEVVDKIAGHRFGKDKIVAVIDNLLK